MKTADITRVKMRIDATRINHRPVNILFCGMLSGSEGIKALEQYVARARTAPIDLVVVNATNLVSEGKLPRLRLNRPVVFTAGVPAQGDLQALHSLAERVVFPINQAAIPGLGYKIIRMRGTGIKVGVICLGENFLNSIKYQGREVYSPEMDNCELAGYLKSAIARIKEETPIVLVEFYSQGFLAKEELLKQLEGQVTFFGGSQIELAIGDARTKQGTTFVPDIGRVGPSFVDAKAIELDAVMLSVNPADGRVIESVKIKEEFVSGEGGSLIPRPIPGPEIFTPGKAKPKFLAIGDISEDSIPWMQKFFRIVRGDYQGIIAGGEHAWEDLRAIPEIDVMTNGDHTFESDKRVAAAYENQDQRVLFPENYDPLTEHNKALLEYWGKHPETQKMLPFFRLFAKDGLRFGVVNLGDPSITNTFRGIYGANGRLIEPISDAIEELRERTPLILVDFHSESREERRKLAFALDGKVTTVYGTHQHQQYLRSYFLPGGTGLFWDIGRTGFSPYFIGTINRFSFWLSFKKNFGALKPEERANIPPHIIREMEQYRGFKDVVERTAVAVQGIEIIADPRSGRAIAVNPYQREISL